MVLDSADCLEFSWALGSSLYLSVLSEQDVDGHMDGGVGTDPTASTPRLLNPPHWLPHPLT